ncbi:hypothetical protein QYE76_057235 [Lolium multiflorum]|uniref:Ubiquitin-like protease family profile domain-containing protein n=1 Tax=Lolium multiflorum TaxID=4521 RepID=A0AAD8T340_LOLMU|nr:hypothetical protein QYE76_057235 [Lolium multiflorum]
MVRLYPNITEEQQLLIRNNDYGGLLDIKCSKLHPDLCQFLMESFDPASCTLVFPGRGAIPVTEESVQQVIGVPFGDIDVIFARDRDANAFMKEQLSLTGRKQPTLTSLETKLTAMRPANSKFLRLFITFAMCSVLAPTTGIRVSPRVYPSLINIKEAKRLNMCKFVIMILCKSLSVDGDKEQVSPCMLYLMLRDLDINPEGTRVSVWTNEMVRKAIKQDMKENGSFGALPLKQEFSEVQDASDDRTITDGSDNEDVNVASDPEMNESCGNDCSMSDSEVAKSITSGPSDAPAQGYENNNTANDNGQSEEDEYVQMSQSILFSDPRKITKFIEKNAPQNVTQEDKRRFTEAVEYACHGFEASLQMLVRNLSTSRSDPTTSRNHNSMPEKSILPSPKNSKRAPPRKPKVHKDTELQGPKHEDVGTIHSQVETKDSSKITANVTKATPSNTTSKENVQGESKLDGNTHSAQHPSVGAVIAIRESEKKESDPAPASSDAKTTKLVSEHASLEKEDEASADAKNVQKDEEHVVIVNTEISAQQNAVLPIEDQHNTKHALPTTECSVATFDNQLSDHGKLEEQAEVTVVEQECGNVIPLVGGKENKVLEDAEVTLADTDNVTPNTLKFTHIDSTKTEHIAALMRDLKRKRCNKAENDVDQHEINEEEVEPKTTCINFAAIDRNANMTSSQKEHVVQTPNKLTDDSTCSEESESKIEENRRKEFLKYVGTEIHKEPEFLLFEEPEFVDIATPILDRFQLMKNIPQMEPSMDGLETVHDAVLRPECQQILAQMEPKIIPKKRKDVRFVDKKDKRTKVEETNVTSPGRYRTRSAVRQELKNSPMKDGIGTTPRKNATESGGSPSSSNSRRQTRSQVAAAIKSEKENSGPRTLTTDVPQSAAHDPMNRKLDFESSESKRESEREEAIRRAADPPLFDLDTPPDVNDLGEGTANEQKNLDGTEARKEDVAQDRMNPKSKQPASSITPVAHEYEKRISKPGQYAKSPFVNSQTSRTFYVNKSVDEVYSMVCQHGWKHAPRDPFNKEIVIDLDDIYVSLGDLADSVRPRNKLYNTVAEIGINIIKRENQNPKKVIMPLRIAVCFPTLQAFPGTPKDASGHYWLVNLNIKAQRFEIYDSLGNNSEPVNMHACHLLIAGIKTNWTRQYSNSKIKIMDWPIEIIDSPRQNNLYDCGFFTLKNLEACPSRTPATYSQKDIPNIRKLYTDKWLRFTKKANWQLFV